MQSVGCKSKNCRMRHFKAAISMNQQCCFHPATIAQCPVPSWPHTSHTASGCPFQGCNHPDLPPASPLFMHWNSMLTPPTAPPLKVFPSHAPAVRAEGSRRGCSVILPSSQTAQTHQPGSATDIPLASCRCCHHHDHRRHQQCHRHRHHCCSFCPPPRPSS